MITKADRAAVKKRLLENYQAKDWKAYNTPAGNRLKLRIAREYARGGRSYEALGEKYGVHAGTIRYYILHAMVFL